jgi:hypothetical protein
MPVRRVILSLYAAFVIFLRLANTEIHRKCERTPKRAPLPIQSPEVMTQRDLASCWNTWTVASEGRVGHPREILRAH